MKTAVYEGGLSRSSSPPPLGVSVLVELRDLQKKSRPIVSCRITNVEKDQEKKGIIGLKETDLKVL